MASTLIILDRIHLRHVNLSTVVGVYPHERLAPREVIANVTLDVHLGKVFHTDNLADTVDYQAVVERMRAVASESSFNLIENLANKIIETIMAEFSVYRVKISLDKPGAVEHCQSVAFEMERVGD